jgi:hypothetical protein
MNIDNLTIGQAKELLKVFSKDTSTETGKNSCDFAIGRYVIVRCRDAGVHAGVLVSKKGRSCILKESRRLWYWKTKTGAFLSAVAKYGLDSSSRVGCEVDIELTENCEIIICTTESEKSIRGMGSCNE